MMTCAGEWLKDALHEQPAQRAAKQDAGNQGSNDQRTQLVGTINGFLVAGGSFIVLLSDERLQSRHQYTKGGHGLDENDLVSGIEVVVGKALQRRANAIVDQ